MNGKWICYPCDYEIFLAEKVQSRRFQRDYHIAPFWRVDSPYHHVRFHREFVLTRENILKFTYEGRISVGIIEPDKLPEDPYTYAYGFDGTITLPAGRYELEIWIYNPTGLPCLKIDGDELVTDESWEAGFNQYIMQRCGVCECGEFTPNTYRLPVREIAYASMEHINDGEALYDFGKMIMAYPEFLYAEELPFRVYFGETKSEALSDRDCEQIDFFTPQGGAHVTQVTQAFQFMRVVTSSPYQLKTWEEYDDSELTFCYRSDDACLEKIAQIAKNTFALCSREFYLDGIKRDRWIWSGDVFLGCNIDYYAGFNREKIKRSIIALLGKPPVVTYINHIMDYTSYVFITVNDYYKHTGDREFLQKIYPILSEHARFLLGRRNEKGFLYKQPNDWVHVDWNDHLNTDGEVCFEQILMWIALQSLISVSKAVGEEFLQYEEIAKSLKENINRVFWSEERGAYLHSRVNGAVGNTVTAYANIFAVLYGFADDERKKKITQALLNDKSIPVITTPYMQAFRLACLCEQGYLQTAKRELSEYFGSMADTGTSTFWETYVLGEQKEQATAMYGRPFGRSQCHIWGAGAILIIGKYFYGLKNDVDFGERFILKPNLALINNSQIDLPLKNGKIHVEYRENTLSVYSDQTSGEVHLSGKIYNVSAGEIFKITKEISNEQ